jgi:choline-glycine betaine transporter
MKEDEAFEQMLTFLKGYLEQQRMILAQIAQNEAAIAQKLSAIEGEMQNLKMASKMWGVIQWLLIAIVGALLAYHFGVQLKVPPP